MNATILQFPARGLPCPTCLQPPGKPCLYRGHAGARYPGMPHLARQSAASTQRGQDD